MNVVSSAAAPPKTSGRGSQFAATSRIGLAAAAMMLAACALIAFVAPV